MFDKFSDRHIGVTNPEDLKAMLAVIGVKSVMSSSHRSFLSLSA